MSQPSHIAYTFGDFRLDPTERLLLCNGKQLSVTPKAFDALVLLLENAGHLVKKDEFMQRLWPDTFVGDDTLARNISLLRRALADGAGAQDWIVTVPRRGYRFSGTVHEAVELGEGAKPEDGWAAQSPSKPSVSHPSTRRVALAALLALSFVAFFLYWFTKRPHPPTKELTLRQLTAHSSDNPVVQNVISPDGKYLAFTDSTYRMRVKVIASDEMIAVQGPESFQSSSVRWEIAAWFPDSTRFLANARSTDIDANHQSARETSIWIVSLGGTPRKLRDEAEAFSVSPDGSWIAFGTDPAEQGDREIWLMDPRGQQARKLLSTDSDTFICCLQWSRNQQRVIYLKGDKSPVTPEIFGGPGTILSGDLSGASTTTVLPIPNIGDLLGFLWLPDGRLIYSLRDYEHRSGSLWEMQTTLGTGRPLGNPWLAGKFNMFAAYGLSATSNGKTVAFTKRAALETIHIADLHANGTGLSSARHLTLDEYDNEAQAWTPDGKSVIFLSHRDGRRSLYRYRLDSDTEEPLVMGAEDAAGAAVSPDGSTLLYMDCSRTCGVTLPMNRVPVVPLMRVPLEGGTPQEVLKFIAYGRPRCAVSPAKVCVISEQSEDGQPVIFSAFDPMKGRGEELGRFEAERGTVYHWTLSSDGTRIAILKVGSSRIYTLHLDGHPQQVTEVTGWSKLDRLFWDADGNGWFTSAKTRTGWALLHVDQQGKADLLSERQGAARFYGLPSPDGRHLAINATSTSGNAWIIERF